MDLLAIPIYFAAGWLLASVMNLVGRRAWKKTAGDHWTEQARVLWPVRVSAASNIFVIPIDLLLTHRLVSPETMSFWPLAGIAASFGSLLACHVLDKAVIRQPEFRPWYREAFASWVVRLSSCTGLIAAASLMPATFGWATVWIVLGYLIFQALLAWGLMLRGMRRFRLLTPPDARLQQIVDDAAQQNGVGPSATWIVKSSSAQAFAITTTKELLFTSRLLEILDDAELSAVCAHELAHLSESRAAIAGRLLGSLGFMPLIFVSPMWQHFSVPGILILIGAFFGLNSFSRWLAQRLEKRADSQASLRQQDEGTYARALEKLYAENLLPAVNPTDSETHPHLYDRLVAAGITPSFTRPQKPRGMTRMGSLLASGIGILLVLVAIKESVLRL